MSVNDIRCIQTENLEMTGLVRRKVWERVLRSSLQSYDKVFATRFHYKVKRKRAKYDKLKVLLLLCVLLPLENLLWAKLRDYTISRVNHAPGTSVLGVPDPRRTETFARQVSTSRLPEPTPLTVYRAVPQVPPPLCSSM